MEVTFTKSSPPPPLDWRTGKPLRTAGAPAAAPEAPAQPEVPEEPAQADQPVPAPPPEPVYEDATEQTKELYKSMGWGEAPRVKIAEEAAAAAAAAAPAAPAAPAPGAPAAPASAQPEPPEPAELTPQEIATLTARETAKEIAKVLPQAQPPAPPAPEPEPEMIDGDKRDLEVIRYLEATNPKYRGMTKAYTDYVQAHYAYIEDWMAKNPDKEFNPDDDEHAAWYEANQPSISPEDIEQGRIDMAAEAKVQERLKPIEEERKKERQEKALNEAGAAIVQQMDRSILSFVETVDPALATHLKDANGNPILSAENVQKVEDANPIAKEVMDDYVKNQLEPLLFDLEKTTIPELGFRLSPKTNPGHRVIYEFLTAKERTMQTAPPGAKIDAQGRQWMSIDEYTNQLNAINSDRRLSQQQKQAQVDAVDRAFWVVDATMIGKLLVDFYAKKAKAEIERREAVARKRFGVAAPAAPRAAAPAAARPAAAPAPAGGKPRSPASGGQADVRTSTGLPAGGPKTFAKEATDVAFSR